MKDFSTEIINIDGIDYTLFLNRKGIVAWERITKANKKKEDLEKTAINLDEEIVIKDGDNPFEITNAEELLSAQEETKGYFKKLYWIMLYENHKLDYTEVEVLFDKAILEYGYENLVDLAYQMVEDANTNQMGTTELKKLPALRPKKN